MLCNIGCAAFFQLGWGVQFLRRAAAQAVEAVRRSLGVCGSTGRPPSSTSLPGGGGVGCRLSCARLLGSRLVHAAVCLALGLACRDGRGEKE